jgi:hypothetical protein
MPSSLGAEVASTLAPTGAAGDPLEPLSLVVVCAWCGRPIGRGAVTSHRIVSHGICRPCSDDVLFSDSPEVMARR